MFPSLRGQSDVKYPSNRLAWDAPDSIAKFFGLGDSFRAASETNRKFFCFFCTIPLGKLGRFAARIVRFAQNSIDVRRRDALLNDRNPALDVLQRVHNFVHNLDDLLREEVAPRPLGLPPNDGAEDFYFSRVKPHLPRRR